MRSSLKRRRAPVTLAGLVGLAACLSGADVGERAEAKTPGKTYCFSGTCHRVKSIAETEALVGTEETVQASYYDHCRRDPGNPCGLTSSGEVFDADRSDNAASPIYPDGTKLLVWSPATKQALVVRVNNAGPYWGGRKLDLSRGAAEKLGFLSQGVASVRVRVLDAPDQDEATYKRQRTYEPVPGHIGEYASVADAVSATALVNPVALALGGTTQSQPAPVRPADVSVAAAEIPKPVVVAVAEAPTSAPEVAAAEPEETVKAAPARTTRVALESRRTKAKPTVVASARPRAKSTGQRVASLAKSKTASKPAVAQVASGVGKDTGPNDISLLSRYGHYRVAANQTKARVAAAETKVVARYPRKSAALAPRGPSRNAI